MRILSLIHRLPVCADTFEELNGPGAALGVDAGLRYAENEKRDIKRGQVIVLAADGILEARNPYQGLILFNMK